MKLSLFYDHSNYLKIQNGRQNWRYDTYSRGVILLWELQMRQMQRRPVINIKFYKYNDWSRWGILDVSLDGQISIRTIVQNSHTNLL